MKTPGAFFLKASLLFTVLLPIIYAESSGPLYCYQCKRNSYEECPPEDLKPCKDHHDRCVIHTSKTTTYGFIVTRECGLGPCSFNDETQEKSLGMETCDRSKKEYFCLTCCRENGCNKNAASREFIKLSLVIVTTILLIKF